MMHTPAHKQAAPYKAPPSDSWTVKYDHPLGGSMSMSCSSKADALEFAQKAALAGYRPTIGRVLEQATNSIFAELE